MAKGHYSLGSEIRTDIRNTYGVLTKLGRGQDLTDPERAVIEGSAAPTQRHIMGRSICRAASAVAREHGCTVRQRQGARPMPGTCRSNIRVHRNRSYAAPGTGRKISDRDERQSASPISDSRLKKTAVEKWHRQPFTPSSASGRWSSSKRR